MVPGAAPVSAYRTLDLPALESLPNGRSVGLAAVAAQLPSEQLALETILQAFRATGAGLRIFGPSGGSQAGGLGPGHPEGPITVQDPVLAGWLFGKDWVGQQGPRASTCELWRPPAASSRAWLVPLTETTSHAILGDWSGDPLDVLRIIEKAEPLELASADPEHRRLDVRSEAESIVVVSELADPLWKAAWTNTDGLERESIVERAFGMPNLGAWQAVRVPGRGQWTLRLSYSGRDVYEGLTISGISITLMAALYYVYGRKPARGGREGE
jgi:hypothetical protein